MSQSRQYAHLFADAARREVDMVPVWALDRFGRSAGGLFSEAEVRERQGGGSETMRIFASKSAEAVAMELARAS